MALRMTAIDQVLGTDMKKHFSVLSRFQVGSRHGLLCRKILRFA